MYVGGVCNLVISVDLLSKLFPPQIQHKTLQSRKRNGIEHKTQAYTQTKTQTKTSH